MANFKTPYPTEREGQIEFFNNYGIPYNDDNSILVDFTDGVYNGNILEFKLNISDLNQTLFQAIKYLSRMRIKGESVPATILLIDLNKTMAYVYRSEDFRSDIHKVYSGAASKENSGFIAGSCDLKLNYSDMLQSDALKRILTGKKIDPFEMYMPIGINEDCIVGWSERYYRENPNASKGDFLGDDSGTAVRITGEIRDPRHFRGLINPYTGETNERFKYLMDCLNDRLSKKDLGAFYTPMPYARKAAELVQMAVERVPDGNDYIILDRCAGTGNLEEALIGLYDKNGDELISHCVVSTYEYYEYKVLQERIGDKVRHIIPPTEANVVYENGKVANADAMSKEYIENPLICQYVDDPNCTIILFENPPYHDSGAMTYVEDGDVTKRAKNTQKDAYVRKEFLKNIHLFNSPQAVANELSNLFIWSGFKYYLRHEHDNCIIFSPVKYFKNQNLGLGRFVRGFAFNRKYFHATESTISCVSWEYKTDDTVFENCVLEAFDIQDNNCVNVGNISIKASHSQYSVWTDGRTFTNDIATDVVCAADGKPIAGYIPIKGKSPIWNDNIIAYIEVTGFTAEAKHRYLVRANMKRGIETCHGFHMRRDKHLIILPLWVAKMFPQDAWYEKDVYNTTSDGGDAYTHDPIFLKRCLIYACLSNQNKCLSFDGSDGRRYQNELCFDDSRSELPLALKDLRKMASDSATALDNDEETLIRLWNKIMDKARTLPGYNPVFNYGVYQISKELNTFHEEGTGRRKKKIPDYPELNGDLISLRDLLKAYYKSHITAKMFEYELLK